jgi:hypothetical protein
MSGTLKGIDKKNLVTYSTLIAYYVCGISDYFILFFSRYSFNVDPYI